MTKGCRGQYVLLWSLIALMICQTGVAQPPDDQEFPEVSDWVDSFDLSAPELEDWSQEDRDYDAEDPARISLEPEYVQFVPRQLAAVNYDSLLADRSYEQRDFNREQRAERTGFDFNPSVLNGLSNAIGCIVLLALLVAVVYFWQRQRRDTSVDLAVKELGVTDELLNSSTTELNDSLAANLAEGNYREAIRYRFGQVLVQLREKEFLQWVPGKTNAEYHRELPQTLGPSFLVLAKAFDFAFYAGQPVTEHQYHQFTAGAEVLEKSLTSKFGPR